MIFKEPCSCRLLYLTMHREIRSFDQAGAILRKKAEKEKMCVIIITPPSREELAGSTATTTLGVLYDITNINKMDIGNF
jgi:hypothetical protein